MVPGEGAPAHTGVLKFEKMVSVPTWNPQERHECLWQMDDGAVCGERFPEARTLQEHLMTHVPGSGSFQCRWQGCDTTCAKGSKGWRHLLVHSRHLPYECKRCHKFHNRPERAMHCCAQPVSCDQCGRVYKQAESLRKHYKRKHQKGADVPGYQSAKAHAKKAAVSHAAALPEGDPVDHREWMTGVGGFGGEYAGYDVGASSRGRPYPPFPGAQGEFSGPMFDMYGNQQLPHPPAGGNPYLGNPYYYNYMPPYGFPADPAAPGLINDEHSQNTTEGPKGPEA
eukprot:Clim_evm53s151 gene=Clim_evmTU53s151